MARTYTTAHGRANAYAAGGDYLVKVYTEDAWRADYVAWRNESAFHGRQWSLMLDGRVLMDDLPSLGAAAAEAIVRESSKVELSARLATLRANDLAAEWCDACDCEHPDYAPGLRHGPDPEDEDAPAAFNPDGTPTAYTVEMLTGRRPDAEDAAAIRHDDEAMLLSIIADAIAANVPTQGLDYRAIAGRVVAALSRAGVELYSGGCQRCGLDAAEHWCADLEETFN